MPTEFVRLVVKGPKGMEIVVQQREHSDPQPEPVLRAALMQAGTVEVVLPRANYVVLGGGQTTLAEFAGKTAKELTVTLTKK